MKSTCLFVAAWAASSWAAAASVSGTLVDGGGMDDLQVVVKAADGRRVHAYCTDRCGDWFIDGPDESRQLKRTVKGKHVVLHYATEPNRGRIAGPGPDDRLDFVKRIEFAR